MTFVVIMIGVWIGIMVIWYVVSAAFKSADIDRIKTRLAGTTKTKKAEDKEAAKANQTLVPVQDVVTGKVVISVLNKYKLYDKLSDFLEQSGLKWNVARFMHASLGLFLGTYLICWRLAPNVMHFAGLIPAILAGLAPFAYVMRKRKQRIFRFEEQFPESLEFISRSMRAGHAFSVSLEMIHREFQEPLAGEFRRTFEEHNLGLPLDVALQKLSKRIPLLDVQFFTSAVLLQKRTGGNLAEILDKLAYVIRERFKLRGRIRAVSAHGKMTATALSMIPIGVGVLMFYVNPDYARFFITDEYGNYMAAAAIALQLIGYGIMQKIVNIEI